MTDGHPLVWLWLVLIGTTVAVNTSNPLLLFVMAVALVTTGFLAGGPRRASLVTALGAALVATLVWVLWTLLLPRGVAADALVVLPSWSPGPGVTFGGPLDISSVMTGLVAALRAVVVILLFGLAGQLVSARGWLALARSTLGVAAPALHPLTCLGEASVEALTLRQRVRQQGWGRGAAAGWLTSLLVSTRDVARADQPTSAPRPVVELTRLLLLCTLVIAPMLALAFGWLPATVLNNVYGTDMIAVVVVLSVAIGLALPGTPPLLGQWRAADLPQAVAALALTAAWGLRSVLHQSDVLHPGAGDAIGLPWALVAATVLLPLAVGLTTRRTPRRAEVAHA